MRYLFLRFSQLPSIHYFYYLQRFQNYRDFFQNSLFYFIINACLHTNYCKNKHICRWDEMTLEALLKLQRVLYWLIIVRTIASFFSNDIGKFNNGFITVHRSLPFSVRTGCSPVS